MITYRIDDNSSLPVYKQLMYQVISKICNGELQPGDKLPPINTVATTYQMSNPTVYQAYKELEALGYVHRFRKSGYFVNDNIKQQVEKLILDQAQEFVSIAKAVGLSYAEMCKFLLKIY